MHRFALPAALAIAGLALGAAALWEDAQTCRQVSKDVFICTYTAVNYAFAGLGGVLVITAIALLVARHVDARRRQPRPADRLSID